ncbi:hypothetical protein P3X46_014722 [Hevea brasiliensis]|uniref:C2 domain-containing protein n=1 Tax=Hevea brasiliensis TaxID=3981 RepID=A0ABQ9LTM9_HEVBR|nr:BON1-associated protein 2 [Hevea brasiliensis]KAJ9171337.1 hypothetical protein P3X46_014722 [Hevea brasiliensis]
MDSAPRTLEITVLSAENLRLDGKSVKKDAFVVVKFDSLISKSTKADHEGGSNPSWNQKLEMDMPIHARFIVLEVQCKIGSGNRVIGTAMVPVSDFFGGYTPVNYLHFLSYRLRDARGVKNGIINVSVKVKGLAVSGKNLPHYQISSSSSSSRPTWGLPAVEKNYPGGVVTGVPVWCASRA